jgi:transposase, IS5 family
MGVKKQDQLGFADLAASRGRRVNEPLDRLDALVKWDRFEKLVAHLRQEEGPGRKGYGPLLLFKALLLGSLYGLSDRDLEDALCDRLSFRRFLGLGMEESAPDHSVICKFRNALVVEGLMEKLFAELDRQLEEAGMILKRGTMLDATLIETQAARPPRAGEEADDPDAAFAKREGKAGSTYGYKAHVGVDEGSGIIRAVIATPANVNDTVPADKLIRGDEAEVLGDAAYHTHAREKMLEDRGQACLLMRRANKHHALSPTLKALNRAIARRRWSVETTFATWKRRMGFAAIRYIGLVKASAQVTMAAIAFNLKRWCVLAP